MRFPTRKIAQVILGFGFLVLVNVVFVVVVQQGQVQSAGPRPLLVAWPQSRQDGEALVGHRQLAWKDTQPLATADAGSVLNNDKHLNNVSKLYVSTTPHSKVTVSPTELKDIFISVKTTKKYHSQRLDLILDTWWMYAKDVTYIFTDSDDPEYSKKTRGHLINTNCSAKHHRAALCCKLSAEYEAFLASNKRWFCHVDDDTYLNIPALQRLLQQYNHVEDWYLGKPSLRHPLNITNIDEPSQRSTFWFATGGAGFCISRGLALKMMSYTSGGKLKTMCEKLRLPDDCTIGFIISHYLKKKLTVIPSFHSHLEGLHFINERNLQDIVSVSYTRVGTSRRNVVNVGGFTRKADPTRFRSVHCMLNPYLKGCPTRPPPPHLMKRPSH